MDGRVSLMKTQRFNWDGREAVVGPGTGGIVHFARAKLDCASLVKTSRNRQKEYSGCSAHKEIEPCHGTPEGGPGMGLAPGLRGASRPLSRMARLEGKGAGH